jgi:hypothetical protein
MLMWHVPIELWLHLPPDRTERDSHSAFPFIDYSKLQFKEKKNEKNDKHVTYIIWI